MQGKLDGYTRFKMTRRWLKHSRDTDKEQYIKELCDAANIEYTPPVKRNRTIPVSSDARMFPTKS